MLRVGLKKVIKRTAIIFAITLVTLILLLFVLNAMKFRPVMGIVSSSISSALGRKFESDGLSIGYQSDYGFTAYLYETKLANPDWAENPQMLTLKNASVSLSLWDLIKGTFKLTNITAENVNIDIIDKSDNKQNYVFFASTEKQPAEQVPVKESSSTSIIYIPTVSLHNINIHYENDARDEVINLQQVSLEHQALDHNQLNINSLINQVPYSIVGNFGNVNNIFNANGLDVTLQVDSEINHISVKLNTNIANNPEVTLDAMVEIVDIPTFMRSINANKIPPWAEKLRNINLAANIDYKDRHLKNVIIQGNSNFRDKELKLNIQGKSLPEQKLYPLQLRADIFANDANVLDIDAKLDKPYSSGKWLEASLKGGVPDLSYFVGNEIKVKDINFTAEANIVGNFVSINPLGISANYNDDPLTAKVWLNADIKPVKPVHAKLIANVDYHQQMILGVNAKAILPIQNSKWLDVKISGGVNELSEDLKGLGIKLPYKMTNFEYIIRAQGNNPNQLELSIDPLNLNINDQPVLSKGNAQIDLKNLTSTVDVKTVINSDTNSHLSLKGLVDTPNDKSKWLDLNLEAYLDNGEDLAFLAPDSKRKLQEISKFKSKLQAIGDKGQLNVVISPSSVVLNQHELDYSGDFLYGLYDKSQPLKILFNATSMQDTLDVTGKGSLGAGDKFILTSNGHVNDLSEYNNYLPEVTNIVTKTNLFVENNVMDIQGFQLSALSNKKELKLDVSSVVDFNNSEIKNFKLISNLAELSVEAQAAGKYQPLNIKSAANLNAKSLEGLNQFIDGWGIGIVPILENFNLNSSLELVQDSYKFNVDYDASGTDIQAQGSIALNTPMQHYNLNVNSEVIDVKALKKAIDLAEDNQKNYASENDKRNKKKLVHDAGLSEKSTEEVKKDAEQALKKKAKVLPWMERPISTFLEPYWINASLRVKKIVFETDTAKNLNIALQNNVEPDQGKLSVTADSLFKGKINIDTTVKKIDDIYHVKTDTYIGVLDMNEMAQSFYVANGIQKGQLMFNMYGETEGQTFNQILRVFNGKLKVGINDLQQSLANPQGNIGRFLLLLAGGDWKSGISMKCAIGDFVIVKGVYDINELMLDTTGAIVLGSGQIDLPAQRVNIVLDPKAKYVNLTTLSTAFKIVGNFDNIYFYPDAMSTAKTAAIVAGTTALAATGIGLLAVGAVAAGQVGSGVYYANRDFCSTALNPLSREEIKKIKEHNENMINNLLDNGTSAAADVYSSSVDTGAAIVTGGAAAVGDGAVSIGRGTSDVVSDSYNGIVDGGSDLFKSGFDFVTGGSDGSKESSSKNE
jgi:hypothetical protein